jgi:hypothetical protein
MTRKTRMLVYLLIGVPALYAVFLVTAYLGLVAVAESVK